MSPSLRILLQNVSLKAQLLEICNEMRIFSFDKLTHAATKESGNRSDPTAKSARK